MKATIHVFLGISLPLLVTLAGCKVSGEFNPGKKDRDDDEYCGRAIVPNDGAAAATRASTSALAG